MPSRQLSKDKPKKVLPPEQGHAFKTIEQGHAFKTIEQGQTFTSTHLSKTPTHLRKDKLISVANGKCLSKDKLNTFEQGQTYKCLSQDKVLSIKQGQTLNIFEQGQILTDLSKDKL